METGNGTGSANALPTREDPNFNEQQPETDSTTVDDSSYKLKGCSSDAPAFGFGPLNMTHTFPEKWSQKIRPRLSQIRELFPMVVRYLIWRVFLWFKGRQPFIDMFMLDGKRLYGKLKLSFKHS